ncbi:MAG TPA: chemotaxis protein CheC [Gemmatimonadaceae bacterium]|nr:chemotaxis protein CheC [Gemmatimonadaceae bacterium]
MITQTHATPASLSGGELDALREVANIGAGHAATALSTMIGSTIMISVPRVNVMRLQDVPPVVSSAEEPVAAVLLHMLGDLTGRTLLVFPCAAAVRLAELLMHRDATGGVTLGALEESAVKEVGNILSSAYMNALSDFMGMMLLPSPPMLSIDSSAAVLATTHMQFGSDRDQVFCVESEFQLKDVNERLRGFFLLLPDPASLSLMLRTVRAM